MSDILIAGAAGFTGCNIANYMIQYSKYSVASADNLENISQDGLAPALAARNRHQFYLLDLNDRNFVYKMLELENPKCIIFNAVRDGDISTLALHNVIEGVLNGISPNTKKIIILAKDLYEHPKSNNFIEQDLLDSGLYKKAQEADVNIYYVKSCEVIGQRQNISKFIPKTIYSIMNGNPSFEEDISLREWIYAREYYIRVASLIESKAPSGTYRVFSGQLASKASIGAYLTNIINGENNSYDFQTVYPDQGVKDDVDILPLRKMNFGPAENSLQDVLQHVACWYRDNRSYWSK